MTICQRQPMRKRRRERDIKAEIKRDPNDKTKTEHTAKGFKVGDAVYRKKIDVPDPSQILELKAEELEEMQVEDSVLVPYIVDVSSYNMIRKAYLKIKLMHARARHIVCAYFLQGQEKHLLQDYVDDEEYGAGRILLHMLKRNSIHHKAVFVARFCGRIKLEKQRLVSYATAVQKTFEMNNYNAILRKEQPVESAVEQRLTTKKSEKRGGNNKTKKRYVVKEQLKRTRDGHKDNLD